MSDLLSDTNLTNVAERPGQLGGQADHIVLANGDDLNAEGVLVVIHVALGVVGDELLRVLVADRDDRLEELHQGLGRGLGAEVEVDAV